MISMRSLVRAFAFFLILSLSAVSGHGEEASNTLELGGTLAGSTLDYTINLGDARASGKDTITMTFSVPSESWLAVGVSPNGLMVGSDAVVGLPDTGEVLKYRLGGYVQSETGISPLPPSQQTLIEPSLEQNGDGTTTMTYTQIMDEGTDELPIVLGANTFIASHGVNNVFNFHLARETILVDLVAGETATLEVRSKSLWKAHGWCATVAWGILSPLAIGAALLRMWFRDGVWFKIHQYLNYGVLVFTLIAFSLAVTASNMDGMRDHFSPSPSPHRLIGLVVTIFLMVQTTSGIFRPRTPKKGEEKTLFRRCWESGHRVLGLSLLAMGLYQIHSGIELFQLIFSDSASQNLVGIFWWVFVTLVVLILAAFVIGKFTDTATENDDSEEEVAPKSSPMDGTEA